MFSQKEIDEREKELEELRNAQVGTVIGMGCSECSSLEEHKKLEDGTWECLWCGAKVIKL